MIAPVDQWIRKVTADPEAGSSNPGEYQQI